MTVAARNLAERVLAQEEARAAWLASNVREPIPPMALLEGPAPAPAPSRLSLRERLEAREAALDAREAAVRDWEALRRLTEPGTWPLPRTSVLWAFERAIAAWGLTRDEWIAIGQRAYRRGT